VTGWVGSGQQGGFTFQLRHPSGGVRARPFQPAGKPCWALVTASSDSSSAQRSTIYRPDCSSSLVLGAARCALQPAPAAVATRPARAAHAMAARVDRRAPLARRNMV
jgi:hypothetical protein